jgi:glycosyltransferase involved in cell wall biosynthesis
MKIAFVSQPTDSVYPPHSSSLEVQTYQAARRLAKAFDVSVYGKCFRGMPAAQFEEGVRYRRFRLLPEHRLVAPAERWLFPDSKRPYFASPLYYASYAIQVARELARHGFDVIHVHNFLQIASVIKKFNPRSNVVLHMHCDWLAQLDRATVLSRLTSLSALVGCSEFVTRNVANRFPAIASRCRTIYYGIDLSAFRTGTCPKNTAAAPLRILFVGRISPEKGIHVLVDAFRLVASRCPAAELHFVGAEGLPRRSMITELSDDAHTRGLRSLYQPDYRERFCAGLGPELRGRIYFHGAVANADLPRFYRDATVFAFPSEWEEPFGIPVIEAMASGVPVVGTRSGGIVESIEHGRTGFLVNRGDSQALADALTTLLLNDDLRWEMSRNGRQRAGLWSWDRTISDLIALYGSLSNQLVPASAAHDSTSRRAADAIEKANPDLTKAARRVK